MSPSPDIPIQKVQPGSLRPSQLAGFFVGWPNPPSPEVHLQILEQSYLAFVALHPTNQQVLGFVNVISDGVLSAYIPLLEVLPEHQKKGLGARLISAVKRHTQSLYMLDVICDQALSSFYQKLGFTPSTALISRNYAAQSGPQSTPDD